MVSKIQPMNGSTNGMRQSSSLGAGKDGLDVVARLKERKKMRNHQKEYAIDFSLDIFDVVVKLSVVATFDADSGNGSDWNYALYTAFAIALILSTVAAVLRFQNITDMNHVVTQGYSKRWKKKERINTNAGEEDPRIARDAAVRAFKGYRHRSLQAFCGDLPWIIVNLIRLNGGGEVDTLSLLSTCVAGFGFGVKFAAFLSFIKILLFPDAASKRSDVYEALAANVACGVSTSITKDTANAIEECYESVFAQLGEQEPTFVILVMTAPHDHEAGLKRFRELAPNAVCCGSTTCQGVMTKTKSIRNDHVVVGMWGIFDPEGNYQVGMVDYEKAEREEGVEAQSRLVAKRINGLATDAMLAKDQQTMKPAFVWVSSSPGPEDRMLAGLGSFLTDIPLVGGSAADNDISGKWKLWCTQGGDKDFAISSNGCAFTIAHCSALCQTQLFTGYNATDKKGRVTSTEDLRHILTVDEKPVCDVYNGWTGGEYDAILAEKEDSNILGPSSLYPLGQACGTNTDGEVFYRSMHPHMFMKETKSMTLFSDVREGEEIVMMAGTKANIVNRIAGVASHVVRESGFSLNEIRGSIVIFCAGCMMFATDEMDEACRKLNGALGGTPYLGIHTFGEQGAFPDGKSRHGNLMFSALVVSSRRRVTTLLNVDTGKIVSENDKVEFEKIVAAGGYKG